MERLLRMKIKVEANIIWHGAINETAMESVADALHEREHGDDGGICDVSIGGSLAERWLDISFAMMNVERKSIEQLVSLVNEIVLDALRPRTGFAADVPRAHVIDAIAFRPMLSPQS